MRSLAKWLSLAAVLLAVDGLMAGGAIAQPEQEAEPIFQVEGVLEEGDQVIPDDGSLYDAYPIEGRAGQTIEILMESEEFDAYLLLLDPQGEAIAQNNDLDQTTSNAGFMVTLPEDATYGVIANAADAKNRGQYQLLVREVIQVLGNEVEAQLESANRFFTESLPLWHAGQYQLAIEKLQQALEIYRNSEVRAAFPQESYRGEGETLTGLGAIADSLGQYESALAIYQQALSIFREEDVRRAFPQESRAGEGNTLSNIGTVQANLGQYELALESLELALNIRQEVSDRTGEGATLINIGSIYERLGQYELAIETYQQALDINQDIGSRIGEGVALNNIGSTYEGLGQYESALELYQRALNIFQELDNLANESNTLTAIGSVYDNLGRYELALEQYGLALDISQEIGDRRGEANTFAGIGLTYNDLGRYEAALEAHQQALAIFQDIGDRPGEGVTLNNIGLVRSGQANYEQALEAYQQALTISQEIGNRRGEGSIFSNIGEIYRSLGQYEPALDSLERSLAIRQEVGDRAGEGFTLNNTGAVYGNLGQHERALEIYQQSLAISQEIGDRASEGNTLGNIGLSQMHRQQYTNAERTLYEALSVLESLREQGLDDAEKVSLLEIQLGNYEVLQQALIAQNKISLALEAAERGRARATIELLAEKVSDRFINVPSLAEIQRIAQLQNATLVAYSIIDTTVDSALYTWVIQPDGTLDFTQQPLNADIPATNLIAQIDSPLYRSRQPDATAPLVTGLRSATIDVVTGQDPTEKLQELHQLLIDPIAHLLPADPNQKVIFIPQGSLFLVPFAALQDAEGTYLIEKHTIVTAPSIQVLGLTRDIADQRNPTASPDNVLIVGNPTMPAVWDSERAEDTPLRPLPGAEAEANAIAQQLQIQPLIGDAADEATVRQQMASARIIHLATHGLLQYGDPQASAVRDVPGAIALAPSGDPDTTPNSQIDGLLTSAEILDMDLQAELVVLSACDTGRGQITGDGVIGLSRSLMTAGVPSIVVSLWAVDDGATAELMREFYRLWQDPDAPMDKAQALRQAMLTTMETHPDPRLWAAFTLIGEAG